MSTGLHVDLDGALGAVLDDMQQALAALAGVLEDERIALLAADVAALDAAGGRKQALVQQLEQLDAERVQLGQAAPRAAQALEVRWQSLMPALAACRDRNQRNGQLVGQRLESTRRALWILTGQQNDGGVYGRTGSLHLRPRSQTLAEA
ncbi:MAG: flagellar export chaperone FlgN [Xanthomonadaceae bacterium]|nr:flagellar export chaperone FlgN [Xanthomonadaceae bacterium]MDE1963813.1 flagellar protein FlgN [Xanthomonadaceae bacterium]